MKFLYKLYYTFGKTQTEDKLYVISSDHPVPAWTPCYVCVVDCCWTTRPYPACWFCCLWMSQSSTPAVCTACSGTSATTLRLVVGSFGACCPSSSAAARVRCVWRQRASKILAARGAPREAVEQKGRLPLPSPRHPRLHPHLPWSF